MNKQEKTIASILALLAISALIYAFSRPSVTPQKHTIDLSTIQQCSSDADCMLVQDSWCQVVLSANKGNILSWIEYDETNSKQAEANNQTCKPTEERYTNVNNFIAKCGLGTCQAVFANPGIPDTGGSTEKGSYTYIDKNDGSEMCADITVFETNNPTNIVVEFELCEDNIKKFTQEGEWIRITTTGDRFLKVNTQTGEEILIDNQYSSGGIFIKDK